MCGRFTLYESASDLVETFGVAPPASLGPRYNIAPGQKVLAVRAAREAKGREAVMLAWGLVPPWAQDSSIGSRLINARAETVVQKPAFRGAFRNRRCLVPASGFYEWKKTGGRKQPFYIRRRDGGPLALAGLWERWEREETAPLETCAIVTAGANDLIAQIHDRMPVILPSAAWDAWLDPRVGVESLLPLLVPAFAEELAVHPVGLLVNNPNIDDPRLILFSA